MALFDDLRSAWGARKSATALTYVAPAKRTEFFNHYDGGSPLNLPNHSDCLARVKQDQAFHMDSNGWSDIGYNGLVCQHGRAIEGRGIDYSGAHCPDHNTTGYGFQFMVGGSQVPTPAAYARMARLYADCSTRSGHSLAKKGHRDGFATACPGDQIYSWVKAGMPSPATPEDDMPLTEDDARLLLTGSAVLKNPFAADPDTAPRVAASYVLEQTAAKVNALANPAAPALSAADITAIATKVADLLAARLKS